MSSSTLSVIKSTKGKSMLMRNGYVYVFERNGANKLIWKCSYCQKTLCRARLHTTEQKNNPELISELKTHNHEPDPIHCEARVTMNDISEAALSSTHSPSRLVAQNTVSRSLACKGRLPLRQNIARTIRRVRSTAGGSLSIPHNRQDISLPLAYTTYKDTNFLLFDSGAVSDRIMVFSTQQNLNFLQTCETWMMDGTFKSAPVLFDQVFVLHGYRNNASFPLVFCLTPNRTTSTYQTIFQQLKALSPGLNPKVVMSDFERASRNAFQLEFPNVEAKGCFFHFRQCVNRNIQRNREMYLQYSNDSEFQLMVKHLVALAFLPPEDVLVCYEKLMDDPFFVENGEVLVEFMQYFERTWIGTRVGNRKVSPLFPVALWNCFHSVLEDAPKTNNSCEGFHTALSSMLDAAHPTIHKLVDGFKEQQANTEMDIQKLMAGRVVPQDKRYVNSRKVLKSTVERYPTELADMEYLRRVAYCLSGIA